LNMLIRVFKIVYY